MLHEYDKTVPGAAERILSMAEQEGKHRRKVEYSNVHLQMQGQRFGFVLVGLAGGLFLLYLGRSVVGLNAMIATIVGLIAPFSRRKRG